MRNIILFYLLLFPSASFALDVNEELIFKNRPPGFCMWASCSTLARVHNWPRLINLLDDREKMGLDEYNGMWVGSHKAHYELVNRELDKRRIYYYHQRRGNKSLDWTKYVEKYGAIIAIEWFKEEEHNCHAIILTKYNKDGIIFCDTNNQKTHKRDIEWFNSHWNGEVLLIYGQK